MRVYFRVKRQKRGLNGPSVKKDGDVVSVLFSVIPHGLPVQDDAVRERPDGVRLSAPDSGVAVSVIPSKINTKYNWLIVSGI